MIETLQAIIQGAVGHLKYQTTTYLPPFFAALVIFLVAYLFAVLARWLVTRIFKGMEVDRWLRRSGFSSMLDPSGRLRAARLVAQTVYWAILAIGFLTALNAFNTQLTSRMVETLVFLFPKLVAAVVLLLVGAWLGQYLGRSILVWAVNEELPSPRRLAAMVRALVMFIAIVVTADYIDFARRVFLTAFVLILGGAVLAASLALGLGAREAVRRYLQERSGRASEPAGRSIWNHL